MVGGWVCKCKRREEAIEITFLCPWFVVHTMNNDMLARLRDLERERERKRKWKAMNYETSKCVMVEC